MRHLSATEMNQRQRDHCCLNSMRGIFPIPHISEIEMWTISGSTVSKVHGRCCIRKFVSPKKTLCHSKWPDEIADFNQFHTKTEFAFIFGVKFSDENLCASSCFVFKFNFKHSDSHSDCEAKHSEHLYPPNQCSGNQKWPHKNHYPSPRCSRRPFA